MPEPSPELVLIAALVQAHMKRLPKKERPAFLADVSETLDSWGAAYSIVRIRPRSSDQEMRRVMTEATVWWRQALGVLSRMSPPE